jgi:hypothetical protein
MNVQNRLADVVAQGLVAAEVSAEIEAAVNSAILNFGKTILNVVIEWDDYWEYRVLRMSPIAPRGSGESIILSARTAGEAADQRAGYVARLRELEQRDRA